jgi:trans-aconitate methyltransferase
VTEWDANAYHRVSSPQTEWGRRVLARLEVSRDARVIDAGCGTGRLTRELLARIPDGRLMAVDRSWNMLVAARANLEPEFAGRVRFCQIELPRMPFVKWADLVFSTATFHWVRDHVALFAEILVALRRGGRLFAQCGGGPNLAAAHAMAREVMRLEPFAPYFRTWDDIWEFATPEATAERLRRAGFVDVVTSLEPAATILEDEAAYRSFVTTVIYHPHLERLPDAALRTRFIDEVTARAARQSPPFTLDYWRLNLEGQRP